MVAFFFPDRSEQKFAVLFTAQTNPIKMLRVLFLWSDLSDRSDFAFKWSTITTVCLFTFVRPNGQQQQYHFYHRYLHRQLDINIFNCIVGSMGVVKQQSDLNYSFSQIYQIDRSIFVDRSERSERVETERSQYVNVQYFDAVGWTTWPAKGLALTIMPKIHFQVPSLTYSWFQGCHTCSSVAVRKFCVILSWWLSSFRRRSWATTTLHREPDMCHFRTHSTFGDRAFAAAGPRLWKSLPPHLRDADLPYSRFRRSLKTFLFG